MSPSAVQITLVRHGQTQENLMHILQGQMPGHLTGEGISQARQLGDTLPSGYYDCILCSDLQRALDTAFILNEKLQIDLIPMPILRERDFGIYTGKPYGIKLSPDEPTLESIDSMKKRAMQFLHDVQIHYPGKKVLVVSHGLFLRVLQSVYWHKDIKEIFPMRNAETRTIVLEDTL